LAYGVIFFAVAQKKMKKKLVKIILWHVDARYARESDWTHATRVRQK
jgi:hypothetical protein